jgi:hypothetical protein
MTCVFCSAHGEPSVGAAGAVWAAAFRAAGVRYGGPVCPACKARYLVRDGTGELELRGGVELPPHAAPGPTAVPPPVRVEGEFPGRLVFEGKRYVATGKLGTRVVDGVQAAEYEAGDAARVWLGRDGRVVPD